jgi:hypothetical protein
MEVRPLRQVAKGEFEIKDWSEKLAGPPAGPKTSQSQALNAFQSPDCIGGVLIAVIVSPPSGLAEIKSVVGRDGLEPSTSAVLGPERCATERGMTLETTGVIRPGTRHRPSEWK